MALSGEPGLCSLSCESEFVWKMFFTGRADVESQGLLE